MLDWLCRIGWHKPKHDRGGTKEVDANGRRKMINGSMHCLRCGKFRIFTIYETLGFQGEVLSRRMTETAWADKGGADG